MSSNRLLAAGLLAAVSLTGCEQTACTATSVEARPAQKVNLRGTSAVVEATLAASGVPLPGRPLTISLYASGASVHSAGAVTDSRGVVRYDLKRVDAAALTGLARADEWSASFAGDSTYCGSSDTAAFSVL